MGQGASQLFDNLTYNPDVQRQKAADQKEGAKIRDTYREILTKTQKEIKKESTAGNLTPEGTTLLQGVIDKEVLWLKNNPTALSDTIYAETQIFSDAFVAEANADRIRRVFYNALKVWNYTLLQLQNQNLVSADKAAQFQKVLDQNQVWYTKNLNSPLETLQEQIETIVKSAASILNEPAAIQKIQAQAEEALITSSGNLDKLIASAAAAKAEKEKQEESEFSAARVKQKIWDQTTSGIVTMLYLVIGLYAGSLVANDSLVRPVSIRVVYFIYAVMLWFLVLPYYIYRSYTNHPPFMGAYLFPLYPYNPDEVKKDSFFEQLVWYKELPLIKKAHEDYAAAAVAAIAAQKSIG
jgi:hypothetical protein